MMKKNEKFWLKIEKSECVENLDFKKKWLKNKKFWLKNEKSECMLGIKKSDQKIGKSRVELGLR